MNDEQNTSQAAATDPQGRLDALVMREQDRGIDSDFNACMFRDECRARKQAAKEAVGELTRLADELKQCSTIGGEWDGTEEEAKEEYDRLMALAERLSA